MSSVFLIFANLTRDNNKNNTIFVLNFPDHKRGLFFMSHHHLYWVVIVDFSESPVYVIGPFFFEMLLF